VKRNADEVMEKFDTIVNDLPVKLKETILKNFEVQGAIPLTVEGMNSIISSLEESIISRLRTMLPHNEVLLVETDAIPNSNNSDFSTWWWGQPQQRAHMVPANWRLPTCSVQTAWGLWFYGNKAERIQPYKFLKGFDLIRPTDKVSLSRLKKVMTALIDICRDNNKLTCQENPSEMEPRHSDELISFAFPILCKCSNDDVRLMRMWELQYNTVYHWFLRS
jgi:hypothetical protein